MKAWVLLPVWCPSPVGMTGKVRVEPTLHLQSLDLSSCHLHVYGDFIDTLVCFGIFLSATGIYLWTTFSMKYLNIGSYQLLKRSVWSKQLSFSAVVPMSEQQDTYVVKWVREWTQAGFEPRFIWVRVMDSTEVGFGKGSNTFPCWSSVAWMMTTRETGSFVRFFRSCGGIYNDGRQIKNDCHWQCKVHNVKFWFWCVLLPFPAKTLLFFILLSRHLINAGY